MSRVSRKTARLPPEQTLAERLPLGVDEAPGSLAHGMREYLHSLQERAYSPATLTTRAQVFRLFLKWCEERGLHAPTDLSGPILERYQRFLFAHVSQSGRAFSVGVQRQHLAGLRVLFAFLVRQRLMLYNPTAELLLPRPELRLPRFVLTEAEAEAVLAVPDLSLAEGLRDRAILELLYSSGLRRAEVAALSVYDLEFTRGTAMVRKGKGKKDRVVPVSERALAWLSRYVREARSDLVVPPDPGTLFLSPDGGPARPDWISQRVTRCVERSGIAKHGSAHMFRHTLATAMLENGADVRYVQELLGHKLLTTTQLYTRVAIGKLKAVHAATAPGRKGSAGSAGVAAGLGSPADASVARSAGVAAGLGADADAGVARSAGVAAGLEGRVELLPSAARVSCEEPPA